MREEAWNPLGWVYLLGGGLFGLLSRDFAPLATDWRAWPDVSRACRRCWTARAALVGVRRWPPGRPVPDRDRAGPTRRRGGADRSSARRGRDRDVGDPEVAAIEPRLASAAGRPGGPRRRSRPIFATGAPRQRRGGPARTRAVRTEDAPHDALRDADAGADPGPRRARVRRRPGRDGPARPGAVADWRPEARPRTTIRRSCAASSTPSPSSIPPPRTSSTTAASSTPGSRRSAARPTSSA